jgi:hypothetical protein
MLVKRLYTNKNENGNEQIYEPIQTSEDRQAHVRYPVKIITNPSKCIYSVISKTMNTMRLLLNGCECMGPIHTATESLNLSKLGQMHNSVRKIF